MAKIVYIRPRVLTVIMCIHRYIIHIIYTYNIILCAPSVYLNNIVHTHTHTHHLYSIKYIKIKCGPYIYNDCIFNMNNMSAVYYDNI